MVAPKFSSKLDIWLKDYSSILSRVKLKFFFDLCKNTWSSSLSTRLFNRGQLGCDPASLSPYLHFINLPCVQLSMEVNIISFCHVSAVTSRFKTICKFIIFPFSSKWALSVRSLLHLLILYKIQIHTKTKNWPQMLWPSQKPLIFKF